MAIIIPNRLDNDLKIPRDVVLFMNQEANLKANRTVGIGSLHRAYDPTAYPGIWDFQIWAIWEKYYKWHIDKCKNTFATN